MAKEAAIAIKDRAGCSFAQVEFCSDSSARKSKHKKMSWRSRECTLLKSPSASKQFRIVDILGTFTLVYNDELLITYIRD